MTLVRSIKREYDSRMIGKSKMRVRYIAWVTVYPIKNERGDLITHRFSRACRHNAQSIAP